MKERVLIVGLSVAAILALGVVVVFAFGTPQVTAGEVPPPDPSTPLAIEIPGCVCHSDDPVLVEEHANYRMNQCFGCHAGGMPEMGK